VLAIVDDCTKELVDLVADSSISGHYVCRVLDRAARFRGYPQAIRTDQGPEFTGKALDQWAYEHGVELKLIQAGMLLRFCRRDCASNPPPSLAKGVRLIYPVPIKL
jgi:transposase InsO family protein